MGVIDKTTLKKIPRLKISIYKYKNKNDYYCKFYVGKIHYSSGYKEVSLQTKNINEAISKANTEFKIWFSEHKDTTTKKDSNIDLDIAQPYLRFKIRKYKHKTHLKNNEQWNKGTAIEDISKLINIWIFKFQLKHVLTNLLFFR